MRPPTSAPLALAVMSTTPQIRLLASTGPLMLSPLGWVMQAIADAGFDGAELVVGHAAETRDADRVRALADQTGLDIPAVHGPYMLLMRHVLGAGYRDKTRRSMELASAIGADVMVAHAPFRFERGACRWLRDGAAEELSEFDARFAMENLFPVAGRNFSMAVTPEELTEYPHVVFDTSHFAVAGVDLFAAWELLAERVVHLHVSDNLGTGRDSHAPVGAGTLPLARFLRQVKASGWRGTATLELDVRAHLDDRETLVAFLAGQRQLVESLLAGEDGDSPDRVDDRRAGAAGDAPLVSGTGL
jgi:sugar phosphate isomerase/epimerase